MPADTTAHCVAAAAAVYRLPPAIIASILAVEGGQAGTRSRDADGSEDLGPAQINTVWLDEVAKAAGITRAEADRRLQWDGCFNIRVSGAILRHEIDAAGGDFWQGVGHYHSHVPAESFSYVKRVVAAARALFGSRIFASR
jgi:hypothetical protein